MNHHDHDDVPLVFADLRFPAGEVDARADTQPPPAPAAAAAAAAEEPVDPNADLRDLPPHVAERIALDRQRERIAQLTGAPAPRRVFEHPSEVARISADRAPAEHVDRPRSPEEWDRARRSAAIRARALAPLGVNVTGPGPRR